MEEKKKHQPTSTRNLKIYAIVFLSLAMLLLIVAAITQQRAAEHLSYYQSQLDEKNDTLLNNQTMLSNVQEENQYLKEQLDALQKQLDDTETAKSQANREAVTAQTRAKNLSQQLAALEQLSNAQKLLADRDSAGAKELLEGIDSSLLSPASRELYAELAKELLK